jgi:hypothetical protein
MKFKHAAGASVLAAGVGITGLLGVGLATAGAQPGPGCGRPGTPSCGPEHHDNQGHDNQGGPDDWNHRGPDQARQDHQPFNRDGQRVTPVPAGNGVGWGYWFFGQWIPL